MSGPDIFDPYDKRVMDAAADCCVYPESIVAAALNMFFERYADDGDVGHDVSHAIADAFERHRSGDWS